jgi:hypothetical protein
VIVELVVMFQSPRGDFGFLKLREWRAERERQKSSEFQSPRGDFGFLKVSSIVHMGGFARSLWFQSPRGDFGFLKIPHLRPLRKRLYWAICAVSVC